jgi:hypothetical protein
VYLVRRRDASVGGNTVKTRVTPRFCNDLLGRAGAGWLCAIGVNNQVERASEGNGGFDLSAY